MNSLPDRVVRRRLALGLALAGLLSFSGGCYHAPADSSPPEAPAANTPVAVAVVYPERSAIHREVSQPGYVQAFEETPMFAKIAGYVQKWHVDRGDFVKKDQVLAELWVPEREVALRQKEALVRQTEAEIKQAKEARAAAEAAFHTAEAKVPEFEAKYQAVHKRYMRTKSQSDRLTQMKTVVDKENVEEAQLGFQTATANLAEAAAAVTSARAVQAEAKANWNKAEADVAVVEARLRVTREDRDFARTMLDYARLPAPYEGVVTDRTINRGDFVQPAGGDKAKPLYVVMRTDLMRIFVQVPETDAEWVRAGTAARVRMQALPGREFPGRVTRIAWALDPATRTLLAEIDLPNRDGPLRPGMYAYATLTGEQSSRLTLPRSAIVTEGDVTRGYQSYCYVAEDGTARRLPLELGPGDNERVKVLRKQPRPGGPWEALSGTEEIVQCGSKAVRDGQRIRPER